VLDTLPVPPTAFIERPTVQTALDALMRRTDCRLITLTGLGGVGKTRLAIDLAARHRAAFSDGVLYVSLTALQVADQIYTALISTLKLPLYGTLTPEQEVFQYLREKQALLVLDNVEHPDEGALLLSRLLAHAHGVKIIVTARQRLNLQEEWVYPVQPLPLPEAESPGAAQSEAVQLFIQSASRAQYARFDSQAELDTAIRICQLVEGLPLAIELAASWTRMLSGEKIAREIASNIDFLSTPTRNVEERHRSMRAVFNSSWQMLSPTEQRVFSQLSVFRNGFTEAAASAIAKADLFTLLALVDKSLVQVSDGRYTLHEMLRQYAYEQLAADPNLLHLALDRHASYYADLFERYGNLLVQDTQDPIYIEVMRENQNYFLAWDRLVARDDVATAARLFKPFFKLFDLQSRYGEGERFFRSTVEWLEQQAAAVDPLILARAKIMQALWGEVVNRYSESEQLARDVLPIFIERHSDWDTQLAWRCLARNAYARGNYHEARRCFGQAQALLEKLNEPAALASVLLRLSDIAGVLGEYTNARNYLEQYAHVFDKPLFRVTRVRFLVTLGDIQLKLGNFAEAQDYLSEARQLCRTADNRLGLSVANSALGRVCSAQGDYAQAVRLFEESIRLCDELDHNWGKSFALIYLGQVRALQGDYAAAVQHLEDAYTIAEPLKAHWMLTMAKRTLSGIALQQGDMARARHEIRAALSEAARLNALPVTLEVLVGWAAVDAAQDQPGQVQQAAHIAALVAAHPMSEFQTRDAAERLSARLHVPNVDVSIDVAAIVNRLLVDVNA
jgi:predicted ATPase